MSARDQANGDGVGTRDVLPQHAGRFGEVVRLLNEASAPIGFRRARDILFERFEVLSKKMPAAHVLKLAVDFDKHALFCEIAHEKARSARDAALYEEFQKYLHGEVDLAPAAGTAPGAVPEAIPRADDDEEEDNGDGEDPDDRT